MNIYVFDWTRNRVIQLYESCHEHSLNIRDKLTFTPLLYVYFIRHFPICVIWFGGPELIVWFESVEQTDQDGWLANLHLWHHCMDALDRSIRSSIRAKLSVCSYSLLFSLLLNHLSMSNRWDVGIQFLSKGRG